MLKDRRTILLITCVVLAVLLICIVVVGAVNGVWPWQNDGVNGTYTGATNGAEDPTGEIPDATGDVVDPTQSTAETGTDEGTMPGGAQDPNKPTIGVEVEDPTQPAGENDPTKPSDSGNTDQPSNEISFDDLIAAMS